MVFDLGLGEMLVIAVLVIVFVGPDGLPDLMRVLGRFYGQMRRASDDLRRTFNAEVARVDADKRRDELRQRRLERERARAAASDAAGEPGAPAELPSGMPSGSPDGALQDHSQDYSEEDEHGPALLAPDPRLPPDAAPRAVPRPGPGPAPGVPRVPRMNEARPTLAPREPEAEAPAPRPLPADPTEH
jgi:sec-independent protein translocase protein TatB